MDISLFLERPDWANLLANSYLYPPIRPYKTDFHSVNAIFKPETSSTDWYTSNSLRKRTAPLIETSGYITLYKQLKKFIARRHLFSTCWERCGKVRKNCYPAPWNSNSPSPNARGLTPDCIKWMVHCCRQLTQRIVRDQYQQHVGRELTRKEKDDLKEMVLHVIDTLVSPDAW